MNAGTWLIRNRLIEYSRFKIIMRIVINIKVKPFKCQLKAFISVLYEYKKKMKKINHPTLWVYYPIFKWIRETIRHVIILFQQVGIHMANSNILLLVFRSFFKKESYSNWPNFDHLQYLYVEYSSGLAQTLLFLNQIPFVALSQNSSFEVDYA